MEKVLRGLKKIKGKLIVAAILWIVITIVFVAPLSVSVKDSYVNGKLEFAELITQIGKNITNPFLALGNAFSGDHIGTFWSIFWKFSLFYILLMTLGLWKAMPKHEYDDIEHGSSDWCENGEQYKVLSKDKGILLAEKHYLPITKRGNINVLVVGRFWFSESLHLMLYQMLINYWVPMYLLIQRENYMIKQQDILNLKDTK